MNIPIPAGNIGEVMESSIGRPGLYIHIPFCQSICPFCPYNKVLYDKNLVESYFNALEKELGWYLGAINGSFPSLYIGGGTPTLCLEELAKIMERLSVTGERAIEVLPNHATNDNVVRLLDMGVNYISLGIQSFDEAVLKYLGRPNTAQHNYDALKAVAGKFDCVDVDLIFDIAFDDKSIFLHDFELCLQAGVEQVSTYPLMRFGYTPFGKSKHQPKREHQVLGEAKVLAQRYGYERRSVWTFNRQDAPNYTSVTREFYLGCGAGAGSYSGKVFYLNHFSIPAYIEKVKNGSLPIARITQLSQRKAAAYYLFWQAYTGEINLAHFDKLFPGQLMLKSLLVTLSWFGILQRRGENMVLTPRGYDHYHDLERLVTYRFIEPLWSDMMHEHEFLRGHLSPLTFIQRLGLYLEGMQKR